MAAPAFKKLFTDIGKIILVAITIILSSYHFNQFPRFTLRSIGFRSVIVVPIIAI